MLEQSASGIGEQQESNANDAPILAEIQSMLIHIKNYCFST
jgi:hypothetical protein